MRKAFARPLVLATPTGKVRVAPAALGAKPAIRKAVSRARFARPGAVVPLHVWVSRERIRGYVESLGRELDRAPVSSRLILRGTLFARHDPSTGAGSRGSWEHAIRVALKTGARSPIPLSFGVLKPPVAANKLGPAVVILRGSNRLRLFAGVKLCAFGVATGQRRSRPRRAASRS